MKKLFSLVVIALFTITINAQCITGPTTLYVGNTYTFSSTNLAQCSSCYDWDVNGDSSSSDNSIVGNVQIIGTDTGQSVSIKGLSLGCFTLNLTYFDETGCHVCVQQFCFVSAPPCDINQNGIYQLNVLGDQYVKFYTMPSIQSGGVNNFNYLWTFTYQDGSTSSSNVREPYIPVYCSNPITHTNVVVTSAICSKTITKRWVPGVCGTLNYPKVNSVNLIEVSPNPTASIINFKGENLRDYKISIYDSNGIEIIKDKSIDGEVNIGKEENGIYLYLITNGSGYKQKGKIVKQ